MGVLCSCQAKAALLALEGHEAGQQAESNVHVIAKVVVHVVSHSPEPVGQLLGFNCVQLSLVPLQALQLPVERKEGVKQFSRFLTRKLHPYQETGMLQALLDTEIISEAMAEAMDTHSGGH